MLALAARLARVVQSSSQPAPVTAGITLSNNAGVTKMAKKSKPPAVARTPWKIWDPNKAYSERKGLHKSDGYRPICIDDADGNRLFYVGDYGRDKNVLPIANLIVNAINKGDS